MKQTTTSSGTGLMASLSKLVEDTRLIDDQTAGDLDRRMRTRLAEMSRGLSMLELSLAYLDWIGHLSIAPGKLLQLQEGLVRKLTALGLYNIRSMLGMDGKAPATISDRRLSSERWQRWPFNVWSQSWLLAKEHWRDASSGVSGVGRDHQELVAFIAEQMLEAMSPANFPLTNPDVLHTTIDEGGKNLLRGLANLADDLRRKRTGEAVPGTEHFQLGQDVACTPGKVVYQNRLIELIQYSPQTAEVDAEPVLIVPAWIMKYYILDLSQKNSMVRYLLEQGKTVFMISWKNPGREDSELTMDDYLNLGVLEALQGVNTILPGRRVNAVGYCIGGTLLYIAAAHLAGVNDCLNSITIFAAQADFSEAGEIRRFLGESIYSQLEALMQKRGVLEIEQMGGAFSALRSGDLVWGPAVDRYLLGRQAGMNDLMAWNADGTRMPYRMHSQYLRRLYMDNDLAEGRFEVNGEVISLTDINAPMFVVGTVTDHVAPWQSVYKIHRLNGGEVTFVLTTGGHNAGIVSGPVHPRRKYQLHTRKPGEHYLDPQRWQQTVPVLEGSWWPAWIDWLDARVSGKTRRPTMGAPRKGFKVLRDAPGDYVRQR